MDKISINILTRVYSLTIYPFTVHEFYVVVTVTLVI